MKPGRTAAIVTAAGPVPGGGAREGPKRVKAPCSFCGTGRAILLGPRDSRVEAERAAQERPVNRRSLRVKRFRLPGNLCGPDLWRLEETPWRA